MFYRKEQLHIDEDSVSQAGSAIASVRWCKRQKKILKDQRQVEAVSFISLGSQRLAGAEKGARDWRVGHEWNRTQEKPHLLIHCLFDPILRADAPLVALSPSPFYSSLPLTQWHQKVNHEPALPAKLCSITRCHLASSADLNSHLTAIKVTRVTRCLHSVICWKFHKWKCT